MMDVPLSCVDDVVDEVPDEGGDYEDVVETEQCDFSAEVLGGLLGVVVKDFEADGVVVVLPVYLF
jgi:hypothetical protein